MASSDDAIAGLAALSSAQLREEWQRIFGEPPPAISVTLIELGIAWELQARVEGRLPTSTRREPERLRRQLRRGETVTAPSQSLKPGTRLSRDWHGRTYSVDVLDDGFEFEGRHFSSLTQIATAITGAAWSGPRFFGLRSVRSQREQQK